ncbi:unnamed protein product [Leptidea sinapis]|nr:unnamed protein product [Leptidea sinapis]
MRSVTDIPLPNDVYMYPVFIDGRLVGYLPEDTAHKSMAYVRTLKVMSEDVPITTEIVLVPKIQVPAQYAGVFLFTTEARMMRPVINLATGQLELIGTMEQLYLDIAISQNEIIKGKTTHLELSNNMYQCQMGKQTMGTPIHTWGTNAETKLYRLQTGATPLATTWKTL